MILYLGPARSRERMESDIRPLVAGRALDQGALLVKGSHQNPSTSCLLILEKLAVVTLLVLHLLIFAISATPSGPKIIVRSVILSALYLC